MDVVVLTALDLEYAAVRAHLTDLRPYTDANGTRYETGETRGLRGRVALALTGPGNLAAAALTTRALASFAPKALIFAGLAGGFHHGVALGDVVVATRVHYHQSGKATAEGYQPHTVSWPLDHALDQEARVVARSGSWVRLLPRDSTTVPAVHFKPLVSGDVVVDSRDGHVPKVITEHYSDAVAVDMESAGVAAAAHHNGFHRTISVRAVSDRADGTKRDTDAIGWQWRAVAHAAAFAVALVDRIVGGPGSVRQAGASPFRGLAAFEEDDAELYFGRAETADELAAMVSANNFVTVVGRSGSGKSSLVHAGLVPRMRRRGRAIAAFRPLPGVAATLTLAGGLLPLLRPDLGRTEALAHRAMLADAIAAGRLAEIAGDVLATTRRQRLVVCVDQFEEYVGWREDAARELAGLLARLATGPVHVVLALRTETLDVAVHRLGLGEVARKSVFLLTPMTTAQLREAIQGPVRATGVTFDDGLVTRIADAARDAPGALTLTQFALTRLWDEQDRGRLTHHAYQGFGGVAGALASYAEQVWAEQLDEPRRELARRLLVQLVRPVGDDVVRRTARGSELAPELIPLAYDLATTRLLVTGVDATGEITVDLAHAALATHWRRLRDWLAEERDFRAWQEDLRESVRRAEPLRGARLTDAVHWLRTQPHGISAQERDFVLASRRRQRLRTTAWRGLLAVIVILLGVATTFAVNLNLRTDELADQLRRNAAQALVAKARGQLSVDPDAAALLSVAAYRTSREPDVLVNLAGEYQRYRDTGQLVDPGLGQVAEVAVSADGRVVAVAGSRGTARLRTTGDAVVADRHDASVPRVALSSDGRLMASATSDGRVEVFPPDGAASQLREAGPGADRPGSLRFDAGGGRLLAASGLGLAVWDVGNGKQVPVPDGVVERARAAPDAVWFGPDGQSLVVAALDGVWQWPLGGGEPTLLVPSLPEQTVLVAGDGRTVITCTGQTLEYRNLAAGERPVTRSLPVRACPTRFETATDHSGRFVVADSPREAESHPRDAISLVDRESGLSAHVVVPAAAEAVLADFPKLATTATGVRLVASAGSAVILTDLTHRDFSPLDGWHQDGSLISPDQRFAVTAEGPGGPLHLWDTGTGRELASHPNAARLTPMRFTRDGAYLLATDPDHGRITVFGPSSLTPVHDVALPPEMRQNRDRYGLPQNTFCLTDRPEPGEVEVVYGGLAVRLDLGAGTLSESFPLLSSERDAQRLGRTFDCRGRPGRAEFAMDTGSSVELWDLDRRDRTATLPISGIAMITSLRFSEDGRWLAVAGLDGSLEVWDVEKRQRRGGTRKVVGANIGVQVRGFPSQDRLVVRGGGLLRVWDPGHDTTIADVDTEDPGSGTVAPDGRTLMYWGMAGLTRMPLDPGKWADHLCRVIGRDLTPVERRGLPAGSVTGRVC